LGPIDIAQVAILLDVDGTILDIAATPQSVVVPASLVRTLGELHARTSLVARSRSSAAGLSKTSMICSCRSSCLASADTGSNCVFPAMHPSIRRYAELSPLLRKQVTVAVTVDPRVIVEDKGSSLAVHYRLTPEQEPLIKSKIVAVLDHAPDEKLEMLCGKAVIEIKPSSFNKGIAVCELMKSPPFA
jgi:trehalose 6-phosphate phosphatase